MRHSWFEHIKGSGGDTQQPGCPKWIQQQPAPQSPVITIIINTAVGVRDTKFVFVILFRAQKKFFLWPLYFFAAIYQDRCYSKLAQFLDLFSRRILGKKTASSRSKADKRECY